ncbi:MAG TPA: heme ABC transporter ATP-binding protein CcmA, partial [Azospirillaceae bacterium]|nr:heme ABC transporter ATP-binding protein CcmA [Azospirillaceae bacterium]
PLWLLDEPTVALDKNAIRLLEGIIARHRAAGGMVVLSTHADIALPGHRTLQLDDFSPEGFEDDDDLEGGPEDGA